MNLLLACALLLQETPETAFRKIEAAIDRSKSVRVLYTLMPAAEPENLSRGTLTLEGDTKAKMSADLRSAGSTRVAIFTEFESGKIKSSIAGHSVEVSGDGKTVRQNFNAYLSRLGIFSGAMFEHGFWTGASQGPKAVSIDLKQMFPLTDFVAVGEGANGSRILSYSFSPVFKPMPFTWAKIWYDPRSYRLLRREQAWNNGAGKDEILVEEYEIQLDEEKGGPGNGGKTPATPRSEAEQDVLFIQARIQVADEHLKKGNKQKAIDVLEDLALSFPKHALLPEIRRLLEEAKSR